MIECQRWVLPIEETTWLKGPQGSNIQNAKLLNANIHGNLFEH